METLTMTSLAEALKMENVQAAAHAALNGAARGADAVVGAHSTLPPVASWLIVGAFVLFGVVLAAVLAARAGGR